MWFPPTRKRAFRIRCQHHVVGSNVRQGTATPGQTAANRPTSFTTSCRGTGGSGCGHRRRPQECLAAIQHHDHGRRVAREMPARMRGDRTGQWPTNAAVVFNRDSAAVVARPAVSTGSERLADRPFQHGLRGGEGGVAVGANARAALNLVSGGEAALGIVYHTDAVANPRVQIVDTFPEETHTHIVYQAAETGICRRRCRQLPKFPSNTHGRRPLRGQRIHRSGAGMFGLTSWKFRA